MKYEQYPFRSAKRNYFPLPNEIFSLGLSTGEIATYAYLVRCEDRETYQCYRYKQRKDRQRFVGHCRSNYYPWVSGETDGRLPRLLFSLPSGMDLRYSVSPQWAMPTPTFPVALPYLLYGGCRPSGNMQSLQW